MLMNKLHVAVLDILYYLINAKLIDPSFPIIHMITINSKGSRYSCIHPHTHAYI